MNRNIWIATAAAAAILSIATLAGAAETPKDVAFQAVDRNSDAMAKIGDSIYYFGELGMQEFESAKLLKEVLESGGFTVELGGAGMPTNVWAKWGSGKPVI